MLLLCNYKLFVVETNIIKIGNSKGIRLSKTILEKYNLRDKVEMILERGQIVLKPIDTPRENWEKKFREMNANNDDQLLIDDVFEDEYFDEWN